MIRNLLRLVVLAVIVHAAVKVVPVFWHYVQFKDAVTEVASYPGRRTSEELRDRVVQLATEHQVPIGAKDIAVKLEANRAFVTTAWTAQLEYLPARFYPYDFIVDVEGRPERFNGF
ncbi:MAG: hypothetical protein IT182_18035 [Acidobacteria bacterium]|nr:hypothetical protein [Acidobacteriota bacterium]